MAYEATTLKFANGDKLILGDEVYSGLQHIRKIIVEKASDKIKDKVLLDKNSEIKSFEKKVYAGNVLTSANTLIIIGATCYLFFRIKNEILTDPLVLILFTLIFIFYSGFGYQMNYFIIDNDSFIVKNHYFPWKNKIYSLNNILEMDIEQPSKRSTSLRILTKDFQSKLYGAGSLRQRNWDGLKQDLSDIGIPIRKD